MKPHTKSKHWRIVRVKGGKWKHILNPQLGTEEPKYHLIPLTEAAAKVIIGDINGDSINTGSLTGFYKSLVLWHGSWLVAYGCPFQLPNNIHDWVQNTVEALDRYVKEVEEKGYTTYSVISKKPVDWSIDVMTTVT